MYATLPAVITQTFEVFPITLGAASRVGSPVELNDFDAKRNMRSIWQVTYNNH